MQLQKAFLSGSPSFVASKSCLIRALICACLSGRNSIINGFSVSDDVNAAINAIKALGADVNETENKVNVFCANRIASKSRVIDCGGSAAVLRFMLPICAAYGYDTEFILDESLSIRSHWQMINFLNAHGCAVTCGTNSIISKGTLVPSHYRMDASMSSQFASGLLFAIAINGGNLTVDNLCSTGYVDLTLKYLSAAGYSIVNTNNIFTITPPCDIDSNVIFEVENCFSSNAFWLVGGAVNGDIEIKELDIKSSQPDSAIIEALKSAGANISISNDAIKVKKSFLKNFAFDASECPDIVPILAVLAANAHGESVINGIKRLRFKECDRVNAICDLLSSINVEHSIDGDALKVLGSRYIYTKKIIKTYDDHRIAMSAAIASLTSKNIMVIDNPRAVTKSYPNFFIEYERLKNYSDKI